jgi:tRNA A-37 threonylcarbamoyl transferase component Bud32
MSDQFDRLRDILADRYTIESVLGAGGMATVYLAHDIKHDRKVAVKVLRPELAAVLGADRFLNEIKVTANLQHPHILPLHDSGEANGILYYVMPYVEGESLRNRIEREKQLPVEDAMQISREVADALSYAHGRGVIHRDIKPENILLQSGHAVVADFGIARAIDRAGGETLTETGMALGTPAYMSPEQAAGSGDLDGRTDLYALGCVLYEMLAGQPPFTGPTVESVVHQHLTVEPPNITSLRPAVSAQIAGALERALAKTPADRFNPVALFAEALGSERATGTAAPSGSEAAVSQNWSRMRVALFGVAGVAVIAAAVLIGRQTMVPSRPEASVADRVVVLPYENRTGDATLDPVGQMAAEWITEGLMQTGAVQVVPNFMVAEAASQSLDANGEVVLSSVAQRTESGIAVVGSYYRHDDDLEFHSEVVDVTAGAPFATIDPVWGSADDPRGAIDSVRIQVMGALATRLSPLTGWELPPNVQPPTYEASRAYARGMEEWTRGDFAAAALSFEQAYMLDTTYVRSMMMAMAAHGNAGHAGQSDSLAQVLQTRLDELAPYDRYRMEYAAAGDRGDRPAALAAARAGVELVPFGTLRWALIRGLIWANRPKEALESIQGIHSQFVQNGGEWYYHWDFYTRILHLRGEHQRELEVAREGREHIPGPLYGMLYEARALAALGSVDELSTLVSDIGAAASQPTLNNGAALEAVAEELRAHGHSAAAFETLDRALAWYLGQDLEFKETVAGRSLHGRLLYLREDWEEAGVVFAAVVADSANLVDALGYEGAIAARQGDVASARAIESELAALELPRLRGVNTFWRARIAALLGERDESAALLQRAFAEGVPHGLWTHTDRDLESLHGFSRFEELVTPEG